MKHLLTFLLILNSYALSARGDRIAYKDKATIISDANIRIVDAVATPDYVKFRIKVTNTGKEIMMLKAQDIVFVIGGKEYKPAMERPLTIAPGSEESRVVNVNGAGLMSDKYTLRIGCLYKVKADGKALSIPDFKLPAATNDFTAGGFKATLTRQVRKTDVAEVVFDCYYSGAKLGLIDPGKISLQMPNGHVYANMHRSSPRILAKGDKDDFKLVWKRIPISDGDMQFTEMQIQFGAAFSDARLDKLPDWVVPMERE